jgi:hypothetical protein
MKTPDRETVLQTADALRVCAEKNKIAMTADQRVSEADAAALLCISRDSLKNLRAEGSAPVSYRASVGGCRISYRLYDLAAWIESRREDW